MYEAQPKYIQKALLRQLTIPFYTIALRNTDELFTRAHLTEPHALYSQSCKKIRLFFEKSYTHKTLHSRLHFHAFLCSSSPRKQYRRSIQYTVCVLLYCTLCTGYSISKAKYNKQSKKKAVKIQKRNFIRKLCFDIFFKSLTSINDLQKRLPTFAVQLYTS